MRRDIPPLAEVRRITEKKRDAWWTVLLVDPVATPLVRLTAMRTRITPNQITWGAFVLGLVSAACFAFGDWRWLIAGALVYHLSFILDCMDGKVARLTGQGSVFGAWLDFIFDRIRVALCGVALMAGQYDRTGDTVYIWLALAVVGLDTLRYINSLEIFKIRYNMRKQIKARVREARRAENSAEVAFMEDLLRNNPSADIEHDIRKTSTVSAVGTEAGSEAGFEPDSEPGSEAHSVPGSEPRSEAGSEETADSSQKPQGQVIDLQQEFRHRFPVYLRMRSFLLRHRIRTHLVSGIEFQMGVFIVGPLLDAVIEATLVSGALLLVFELAIIYKLLLSTRDFTRTIDSFDRDEVATAA
ncbi:CDP-alcohol phosphatidyltransferase family protein [Streptomyces phaeochromogenes]|uniref:CDP-alcohol phosphatidyltransferase family protein n=1 Tax=Streptomyces phaeochromogenes TaxID=1923 RepID=A0ABZ1H7A2_STRPH|nr:CDP-alcohol phosphatidyltransferase family protein [Streptomyces phaeochromogenes]MCX5600740.1 CDP-alcohol phosphatidyltransferase family protein [Streptomyces phaeochromogenes]WSD14045.1 CDP-alcohol phosphatidyltransferase family protein [Streptomyces phaeochromogenes]